MRKENQEIVNIPSEQYGELLKKTDNRERGVVYPVIGHSGEVLAYEIAGVSDELAEMIEKELQDPDFVARMAEEDKAYEEAFLKKSPTQRAEDLRRMQLENPWVR